MGERSDTAVGTIALVEGRRAVLIGTDGGSTRWQWMNGDWTAMALGTVEVLGHIADFPTPPPVSHGANEVGA